MAKLHHIEETVDTQSGETTRIKKTFSVKRKKSEDFFFFFLSGLNAIESLSRSSDIKVLANLCTRAEFNTGKVKLTSEDRKVLMAKLNIKSQALTNSLGRLREAKLVIGDRGDYEINPQCFWKGTTDEREKLLKTRSADVLLQYRLEDVK